MKKTSTICLILLALILAPTLRTAGTDLGDFEARLRVADKVRTISLLESRNMLVGRVWLLNGTEALHSTVWLRGDLNKSDVLLIKGWVQNYSLKSSPARLVQTIYQPNKQPNRVERRLKMTRQELIIGERIWSDTPLRLFYPANKAKDVMVLDTRQILGHEWRGFQATCDLTEVDTRGVSDPKSGRMELWVRSDARAWIEVYKGADGTLIMARQGIMDEPVGVPQLFVSETPEKLLENYVLEFRRSLLAGFIR